MDKVLCNVAWPVEDVTVLGGDRHSQTLGVTKRTCNQEDVDPYAWICSVSRRNTLTTVVDLLEPTWISHPVSKTNLWLLFTPPFISVTNTWTLQVWIKVILNISNSSYYNLLTCCLSYTLVHMNIYLRRTEII